MWKFVEKQGEHGRAGTVVGVGRRDIEDGEYEAAVEAGYIDPEGPTGACFEHVDGTIEENAAKPKRAKASKARAESPEPAPEQED